MQNTVRKIAEAVNEIINEYYIHDDVAMRILEAAAGGIENVAAFIEENSSPCEDDDGAVVTTMYSYVGSQNRITIPKTMLKRAEEINGKLNSKKNDLGALTIIPDTKNKRYTVLFGDHTAEHDDARIHHLNSRGQVQFSARGLYCEGNSIDILLYKDGKIVID